MQDKQGKIQVQEKDMGSVGEPIGYGTNKGQGKRSWEYDGKNVFEKEKK
jgi:hypothetical protein